MEKRFTIVIFLLAVASSLAVLPNSVLAGAGDFWKSCCESGCDYAPDQSVTFGGTTYYCCGSMAVEYCNKAGSYLISDKTTDTSGWKSSSCTYADDDSICGNPNWSGGGCTGNAACAGKVAGGSICDSSCQPKVCTGSLTLSISGTATCTITATVSVAGCLSSSAWQVRDDGTVKCSGTGNTASYTCPSWTVTSGSSGTTYTYNLYVDGVKNDTKSKTCPTTGTTTTTMGTTTTTLVTGCGNFICEYLRSETQDNCPVDCKTNLQLFADGQLVTASTFLKPRQAVKAILTFNDSRYNSTQGFDLMLNAVIDNQIVWNESNGCTVCGKKLSEMGCSYCGKGKWGGQNEWRGNNITAYMETNYGRVEFNATLPSTIVQGLHTLKVTPILYSFPITLRAAEVQISITDGLYTFVVIVRRIFNSLTEYVILPLT